MIFKKRINEYRCACGKFFRRTQRCGCGTRCPVCDRKIKPFHTYWVTDAA